MKKFICGLISFIIFCISFSYAQPAEFNNSIGSLLLMDNATGQIIYEKDIDEKKNISGLNKLMGVLLVFEQINDGKLKMSDKVTISESVRTAGGATAFLEVGQEYSVEELLKAVITVNANDAMIALGEKVSGSVEGFINKMNDKAKELGMNNTVFTNVTGINDENQYSTARDLSIVAREVLKNNEYVKMSKVYMYELTHPSGRITEIVNTNRLIKTNPSICDGMMTGSNRNQNYSMVATGKKGDFRLISIVVDAKNNEDRNNAAKQMLEYGFSNYVSKKIYKSNDIVQKDFKVKGGNNKFNIVVETPITAVVEKGKEKTIEKNIVINENLALPLQKGDVVGSVSIMFEGKEIGRSNLICDNQVEINSIFKIFNSILKDWIN